MTATKEGRLSLWQKLIYGSGDFGLSSISMMRSVFYAIYLTDVVGLDPRLASFGALFGIIYDAINDPLIGMISDRVRSRWGRRRPFLLIFAIPFGLSFVILWTAPAWDSQVALILYVTMSFALVDTLGTLISVPYYSLMPELAPDYDERTGLSGFRTVFQLAASLAIVITVPMIMDWALEAGYSQQQGFMIAGSIFGTIGTIAILIIFFTIRETADVEVTETLPIGKTLRIAWSNVPFRFAVAIHLMTWTAMDMVAVVLPYYLLYWMSRGDLLAKVEIFGLPLAPESAFFGLLMLVCILTLPFWVWFARKRNKREALLVGMIFWVIIESFVFTIQPGQTDLLLAIGALAGFGVASAYVLPDSIFPDVIEWDEIRTRRRQEGIYYGARAFIRKLTSAVVIFVTLQLLGWSGYQNPPAGVTQFSQGETALTTIRVLVSFGGAGMLLIAAIIAGWYPLSREKHARMRRILARRRADNVPTPEE